MCVSSVCVLPLKWQLVFFPPDFSNTPNTRMPPPRCSWATRPIHACRPKRLPLGAEGTCSNAPKYKLPATNNHHHHLLLQLLLKVLIVARAIFKRRNPGAAENEAEDLLGFLNTAMKDLATHACLHACP